MRASPTSKASSPGDPGRRHLVCQTGAVGQGWVFAPFLQHLRWSMALLAVLIVSSVTVLRRRPLCAIAATLAWVSVYELAWMASNLAMRRGTSLEDLAWMTAAVGAWPILAHKLGIRPSMAWVGLCAAGWVVWLATGFQYNVPGQRQPIQLWPELLNVWTKTGLGVGYLTGALSLETRPAIALRGVLRGALVVGGDLGKLVGHR